MKKKVLIGVAVLFVVLGAAWATNGVLWGDRGPINTGPRVDAPGSITLGVGEEKRLDDVVITLHGVENDSRCAVDVQCIAAGGALAKISLRVGASAEELSYASDAEPHWFAGYFIDITEVYPEARSNRVIDPLTYRMTFTLTQGRKPGIYAPEPAEYPVTEKWEGEAPAIRFESTAISEDEKKVLTEGVSQGANFAGYYAIVSSPCTATCTLNTIINLKTGAVIAYGIPARFGLGYSATSSLLVVNPVSGIGASNIAALPDTNELNFPIALVPSVSDYYVLKDDALQFLGKYDVRTGEKRTCEALPVSARNPMTKEEKNFPSLCDIPYGYEVFEAAPPEEFERNGETWRRYRSEEYGISFEYRKDPNGYTLTLPEVPEENPEQKRVSYVLTNTKEYEELLASTEPREGPPTLSITVFENPDSLDATAWATAYPQVANFNPEIAKPFATKVAGQSGILYNADGLYASSNVIVPYNGKIYLLTGTYIARTDTIYRDFDALTAFLSFF